MRAFAVVALTLPLASDSDGGRSRGACLQVPRSTELDEVSEFSHVKVTREGDVRTLWFVRDDGDEVIESRVDLSRRDELLIPYTRFMFLSYAFHAQPKRVLIVGLGGGAMVHFLKAKDAALKVDVVEIDPLIVSVAGRFFRARSEGNVDVKVADGLAYLRDVDVKYDVIYMDAFLRPSVGTDRVGVPKHLKTEEFYGQIVRRRLNPNGLVVFNLNPQPTTDQDIRSIRKAFPNVYIFRLPGNDGYVAVASTDEKRVSREDVIARAAQLDERFKASYSFRKMAEGLRPN